MECNQGCILIHSNARTETLIFENPDDGNLYMCECGINSNLYNCIILTFDSLQGLALVAAPMDTALNVIGLLGQCDSNV